MTGYRLEDVMAFQGAIRVEFGAVFPDGAYAAGKFEMVRDFDRSSGDRVVQQIDKATAEALLDAGPERADLVPLPGGQEVHQ